MLNYYSLPDVDWWCCFRCDAVMSQPIRNKRRVCNSRASVNGGSQWLSREITQWRACVLPTLSIAWRCVALLYPIAVPPETLLGRGVQVGHPSCAAPHCRDVKCLSHRTCGTEYVSSYRNVVYTAWSSFQSVGVTAPGYGGLKIVG